MPGLTARNLPAVLASLFLCVALATAIACGDDDDTPTVTAEPVDACLLTEAEVETAIGQDVTATQSSGAAPLLSCQYATATQSAGMNLTVVIGTNAGDAQALFDAGTGEQIAGLGDGARWLAGPSQALSVLTGNMILGVQFFGDLTAVDARATAIALAEATIPRLP